MTRATSYFLLSFHAADRSVDVQDLGPDEAAAAAAYSALERSVDSATVEVVLVGADSLETVRKTHSHYFSGTQDLLASVEKNLLAISPA